MDLSAEGTIAPTRVAVNLRCQLPPVCRLAVGHRTVEIADFTVPLFERRGYGTRERGLMLDAATLGGAIDYSCVHLKKTPRTQKMSRGSQIRVHLPFPCSLIAGCRPEDFAAK